MLVVIYGNLVPTLGLLLVPLMRADRRLGHAARIPVMAALEKAPFDTGNQVSAIISPFVRSERILLALGSI